MMVLPQQQILSALALLGSGMFLLSNLSGTPSLKEAYADDFLVGSILAGGMEGTARSRRIPTNTDCSAVSSMP